MMDSIFSTYRQGENRVTSSILAVFRSLSLSRIERLLTALLPDSGFELIRFVNQPSQSEGGVPDAAILSSVHLLIETKTKVDSVRKEQLERHLTQLPSSTPGAEKGVGYRGLLVLTPDTQTPQAVTSLGDHRVAWASFASLDQAIDELLADPQEVVSERESFLLRQLQVMLDQDGLLTSPEDVLIVAANRAWKKYLDLHAYICQEGRSFRNVPWMGFYAEGHIQQLFPKILDVRDHVVMQRGLRTDWVEKLVAAVLEREPQREGGIWKVFLLSPPESEETRKLNRTIPNDKRSRSGRGTAFTMGQRYVRWEALQEARTTSDLEYGPT